MKKIYKIAVVAALVFFTMSTGSALPAFAEPKELSLEEAIQNIQEYDSEIEKNTDTLNNLKEQISEKENAIKENETKLEEAQKNVDEKDEQLSQRLKGIQLSGGIEATPLKYLEAVFTSGDILDTLKKVSLISQICTSDNKLITEAKESKSNLLDVKNNIEKENKELQENKDNVEKQIKKNKKVIF